MDNETVDFKTLLAAWAENESVGLPAHPSLEELDDYREGRLSATDLERVADHVALCRECFDLLPDVAAFAKAAKGREAALADFEAAAFWRTLEPRLGSESSVSSRPRQSVKRPSSWSATAALAATIAAALLGWTSWSQHQTILDLRSPKPNVEVHALFQDTSVRSGVSSAESFSASRGGTVVFTPQDPGSYEDYAVQILGDDGDLVWGESGFRKDPEDQTFSFLLPPDSLPTGQYRVELAGVDSRGELHPIEDYVVQLEP